MSRLMMNDDDDDDAMMIPLKSYRCIRRVYSCDAMMAGVKKPL
jgi:hypothetical protein